MAFDSADYLAIWRDTKKFPDIHDEITDLVAQTYEGTSVMDFCASIGILGQQLQDRVGLRVCAVEWLPASIERGREFGISVPTKQLRVLPTDGSLEEFTGWLRENEVTGIVARRCLSDVFGGTTEEGPWAEIDYGFATEFCAAVVEAGVREFWLQGRAWSSKATHPLPHTNSEISCLATHFTVAERSKNCAYLRARSAPIEVTAEQRRSIWNGIVQP